MGSVRLEHWWIGLVVAGVAVFSAGGLTDDRLIAAVGLGLLLFGIGEWISHPVQQGFVHTIAGMMKTTSYPRRFKPLGMLFSVVGALLLAVAAARLGISLFE